MQNLSGCDFFDKKIMVRVQAPNPPSQGRPESKQTIGKYLKIAKIFADTAKESRVVISVPKSFTDTATLYAT